VCTGSDYLDTVLPQIRVQKNRGQRKKLSAEQGQGVVTRDALIVGQRPVRGHAGSNPAPGASAQWQQAPCRQRRISFQPPRAMR
jgi:hypothetical protein